MKVGWVRRLWWSFNLGAAYASTEPESPDGGVRKSSGREGASPKPSCGFLQPQINQKRVSARSRLYHSHFVSVPAFDSTVAHADLPRDQTGDLFGRL